MASCLLSGLPVFCLMNSIWDFVYFFAGVLAYVFAADLSVPVTFAVLADWDFCWYFRIDAILFIAVFLIFLGFRLDSCLSFLRLVSLRMLRIAVFSSEAELKRLSANFMRFLTAAFLFSGACDKSLFSSFSRLFLS